MMAETGWWRARRQICFIFKPGVAPHKHDVVAIL